MSKPKTAIYKAPKGGLLIQLFCRKHPLYNASKKPTTKAKCACKGLYQLAQSITKHIEPGTDYAPFGYAGARGKHDLFS